MLIGIALRADVPLGLDLMPAFWKGMVGDSLTPDDVREVDLSTHRALELLLACDAATFDAMEPLHFEHLTMDGRTVSVLPADLSAEGAIHGADVRVTFENRQRFVNEVRA